MIDKLRQRQILDALEDFLDITWSNHFACVEYKQDGQIRVIVALEIEGCKTACEHIPCKQALGMKRLLQHSLPEVSELETQDNIVDSKDIESQNEVLLDCLIDAFFLALRGFA